jgi:hypothetical protein
MFVNGVAQLGNLIPEIWSGKMYKELRANLFLANDFERTYEGEIKAMGDTVRVNTIKAPTASILADDTTVFTSQELETSQNTIVINKRIVASFDITERAQLQSIKFMDEVREALMYSLAEKLELEVLSVMIPSASSPDHQIAPAAASSLAVVDLGTLRRLLSAAKVPMMNRKLALDVNYYSDLLALTNITSKDFVSSLNGQEGVVDKFMGFQIKEHQLLGTDIGYAYHPSAVQLAMQSEPRILTSDLHANGKFGMKISADLLCGISLFDNTRIVKISG